MTGGMEESIEARRQKFIETMSRARGIERKKERERESRQILHVSVTSELTIRV